MKHKTENNFPGYFTAAEIWAVVFQQCFVSNSSDKSNISFLIQCFCNTKCKL